MGKPITRQFEQLDDTEGGGVKRWHILLIGAATIAVVGLGIGIRFYQPSAPDNHEFAAENTDATTVPARSETPNNLQTIEASPEQIAWRDQALEILESLMARLQPLEERGVQLWATDDYERLINTVSEGEQHYAEQRFRDARDEYKIALSQVAELEEQMAPAFETYRERGRQLIAEKQYNDAIESLEIARIIEPDDTNIAIAINTAQNGAAVDRLITKASFAIGEEQPSDALSHLKSAQALDPVRADIRRLISDAQALSKQLAFKSNIQAGYSALESRAFVEAISLFKKAISIEPGSAEADDALRLAEKRKLDDDLNQAEQHANTAMNVENWQEAIQAFEEALTLQPGVAFAKTGLANAMFFSEKQNQMNALLARPARLADDAVARHAASILSELQSVELPPKLAALGAELNQKLISFNKPVTVALTSDGRSTITLLRHESFSPFRKKTLQLKPGQYTVVARRSGYRDKRITFNVPVDGTGISLTIGVDEKL